MTRRLHRRMLRGVEEQQEKPTFEGLYFKKLVKPEYNYLKNEENGTDDYFDCYYDYY